MTVEYNSACRFLEYETEIKVVLRDRVEFFY